MQPNTYLSPKPSYHVVINADNDRPSRNAWIHDSAYTEVCSHDQKFGTFLDPRKPRTRDQYSYFHFGLYFLCKILFDPMLKLYIVCGNFCGNSISVCGKKIASLWEF